MVGIAVATDFAEIGFLACVRASVCACEAVSFERRLRVRDILSVDW